MDIDELKNHSRPILDNTDASQSALTEIEFKIEFKFEFNIEFNFSEARYLNCLLAG